MTTFIIEFVVPDKYMPEFYKDIIITLENYLDSFWNLKPYFTIHFKEFLEMKD